MNIHKKKLIGVFVWAFVFGAYAGFCLASALWKYGIFK